MLTCCVRWCSWHNRQEFVTLVEKYRLYETKLQTDAIRRGLATIVPIQLYVFRHKRCD